MKGIVNTNLNERLSPNVNAKKSGAYDVGDEVNVVEALLGEPYEGDDLWYRLDNGAYVWNAAVTLQDDLAPFAPEDRDQFLLSYRKRLRDGRPDMDAKEPADQLYFAPIRLPATAENIRVNDLMPNLFADGVTQSVLHLEKPRKHVFIYIHGFQVFSSMKLDLLNNFVRNYMTQPDNSVAKVLFMIWPSQNLGRKTIDDRSVRAGQQFTANNLFESLIALSDRLKAEGKCLNLIVHSFGHQLLNGMLNPHPAFIKNLPGNIFENIFLMAPDVTHRSISNGGIDLYNYFKDRQAENFHYDLARLQTMTQKLFVFYSNYDYLLHSSTKRFVGGGNLKDPATRSAVAANYLNLGNFGNSKLATGGFSTHFECIDVQELIEKEMSADLSDFPFRNLRTTSSGKKIEKVLLESDYDGINTGRILTHLGLFGNHHRYLFTSKAVVRKVLELLNT